MPTYKVRLGNTFDSGVETVEVTTYSSLVGDDVKEEGSLTFFRKDAANVAIYPTSRILSIVRVTEIATASGK